MKTTTRGERYGFTRSEHVDIDEDDPADIRQAERWMAEPPRLNDIEDACRAVLTDHGLPEAERDIVLRTDGERVCWNTDGTVAEWQDAPDDREPEAGWLALPARWLAEDPRSGITYDRRLGYALRVLDYVLDAREAAQAGQVSRSLDHAFAAGEIYRESGIAEWYGEQHRQAQRSAWARERDAAVEIAARRWRDDPSERIGQTATAIKRELVDHGLDVPQDAETIKGWLNDAEQRDKLTVPADARKRGRPSKRT